MKIRSSIKHATVALSALATLAVNSYGAGPALTGQVTIRPLTPTEIKSYSLTGAQVASGLNNVGLGGPVYLDALVNAAIAPSNIVSVTWSLTNAPLGSAAVVTNSPLGTNVPIYKSADRWTTSLAPYLQIAGRAFVRPLVPGSYTVLATITTTGSGSTNIAINFTAGTYIGAKTCELCHSGSLLAPSIYPTWVNTPHASFFTRAIDGLESDHYSKNCIQCHLVGYDTNTNAINGGWDDIAAQLGYTLPNVFTNGNWAALPQQLKDLSNIQCENCHGPGSQHLQGLGNTNLIAKSLGASDCSQCHDSLNTHYRGAEWNSSLHARTTRTPSGAGREACVRCHTAGGFIGWANAGGMAAQNQHPTNVICATWNSTNILTTAPNTAYEAITCQTCHDPHDAANPHQLRMPTSIVLSEGTVVTNAGSGGFCMECHNSRMGSYTNMIAQYPKNKMTWAGGSAFGTHDSPQADILEGVNAETYGLTIPSSAHRYAVTNTCAGCHMQPVASTDPAFLQAGGHTFSMTYTNGAGATMDKVDVCQQCHGPITDFNMVKVDYNGDGIIEGVQDEVQRLMDRLSTMLPPRSGYQSDPSKYVADGLVKRSDSLMAIYTNVPLKYLKGYYNWDIVFRDGSLGIHNAQFVVGLLKASISDLSGTSVQGGLPDWWSTLYFGSPTNAMAAPNFCAAGDGVPNWMKYALGINPLIPGQTVTNGVVWNNVTAIGGETNTVHIYTAAEVAFDTEVGKTYQIQGVSSLSGDWQNLGTPVAGTGGSVSLVTPTRNNVQQYFRVVHTP
jgi:hypothetical protein